MTTATKTTARKRPTTTTKPTAKKTAAKKAPARRRPATPATPAAPSPVVHELATKDLRQHLSIAITATDSVTSSYSRDLFTKVHVETHPTGLMFVATNSYVLVSSWHPFARTNADRPVVDHKERQPTFEIGQPKRVIRMLKEALRDHNDKDKSSCKATITVDAPAHSVRVTAGTQSIENRFGGLPEFPLWRNLLITKEPSTTPVALSTVAFAPLAAISRIGEPSSTPVVVQPAHSNTHPVTFSLYQPVQGIDVVGAVMPVRMTDERAAREVRP